VAGYIGTRAGRDLNAPGSQGLERLPQPKPKRFSVSYHLLALRRGAPRLRVQVWVDDGEAVPSVVPVWPTADWHEREAWDLMGIRFDGHPNLVRILMDDDWEGHPLRKDYPIGGEPVRFSEAE
jgi:NADH-quinone oxidoreductase subunit C